jgi:hypothetical protein
LLLIVSGNNQKPQQSLPYSIMADVTVTQLRPHVTDSNEPSSLRLVELRLSSVGAHLRPGFALGHSFGTPPRGSAGQRQSRGLDWYDQLGLAVKFP